MPLKRFLKHAAMVFALSCLVCACHPWESSTALQHARTPADPHALLQNIDLALRNGWLLQVEFFQEDNLKQFFGTGSVVWIRNTETQKIVEMRGVTYLSTRGRFRTISAIRNAIDADVNRAPGTTRVYANASFSCSCNLTFKDVERVFGRNRRTITDQTVPADVSPHSFPSLPPATDAMGNKIASYVMTTPAAYRSTLDVEFDSDGTVKALHAKQEEQQ